jgi:formylmethanofuran dehydrogenase subunit B
VELGRALDEAAAILTGARAPLVYGLAGTTCEAQRAAVALADALGAVIEPGGASGIAFQMLGGSSATLGDVRDRAEVVVIWRSDPVTTHPRLFERLRLPAPDRVLVVVDEQRTATAERADVFLELPADVETLWTLRALVHDPPLAEHAELGELAERLTGSANAAIMHNLQDPVEALALHALVRDLCRITHVVAVTLRPEANAAGAQDVLAWQTGYPAAVDFAQGHPRYAPGELSDADAALVIASELPPAAAIPVVSIDHRDTATAAAARVAFTTAAPGVHRAGVVHRLDGVPVPLRAVLASERPGDDQVLEELAKRVTR